MEVENIETSGTLHSRLPGRKNVAKLSLSHLEFNGEEEQMRNICQILKEETPVSGFAAMTLFIQNEILSRKKPLVTYYTLPLIKNIDFGELMIFSRNYHLLLLI